MLSDNGCFGNAPDVKLMPGDRSEDLSERKFGLPMSNSKTARQSLGAKDNR